jgi:predicted metalloprotease
MVYTKQDFEARVSTVGVRHSKLVRRGYTARVDRNGIIIAQIKPRRFRLPVKGVMLIALGFLGFKGFMLAANGPDTYLDRLALLQNGTAVEAMGARVLAIDPATQFIADHLGPLLR